MTREIRRSQWALLIFVASLIASPLARADAVCDWNTKAGVYDGVHFRNSTEIGTAMGKQVGTLAVAKFLQRSD